MSPKVLPGNTPQYLSQMKSDLQKTFSVLQDWSPELINNVRVRVHGQHVEMCMQLWEKTNPHISGKGNDKKKWSNFGL